MYVTTSCTYQYPEMLQPFGCWREYRTCPYNTGRSGTCCKKSSYEKFGETIRFVEYSPDAAAWPWPTHQTALLNCGGDDAANLRYCPDAVTLLLLLCLFQKIPALIQVDLVKNYVNKKYRYIIRRDHIRDNVTTRARASPCPVQTYYSSKQPREAATLCSITTGTAAAVVWYLEDVWYVPGMCASYHTGMYQSVRKSK